MVVVTPTRLPTLLPRTCNRVTVAGVTGVVPQRSHKPSRQSVSQPAVATVWTSRDACCSVRCIQSHSLDLCVDSHATGKKHSVRWNPGAPLQALDHSQRTGLVAFYCVLYIAWTVRLICQLECQPDVTVTAASVSLRSFADLHDKGQHTPRPKSFTRLHSGLVVEKTLGAWSWRQVALSDDGKAILALTSEEDSPRFWLCTGYCADLPQLGDSLSKVDTLAPALVWDLVCWPATGLYYFVSGSTTPLQILHFAWYLQETSADHTAGPAVCKPIS